MSRIDNFPRRLLVACLLIAIAVTVIFLVDKYGGNGGDSQVNTSSSVTELLGKLPNLRSYGIESCDYAIRKTSTNGWVPSPSDVKVTLKGSAKLSESGFETIKTRFVWTAISREKVPAGLVNIAPAGDLLCCQELNESFSDNPTFAHAFVVIPSPEGTRTIYFLSTDINHPIPER